MAKRVSERATRGGEHGGVGTPHARGASGEALGVGSDEASSISFCLRARWLVSSLTRRCGGPLAHLPSGKALDVDFFARLPVGSNSSKTGRGSVSLI